MIAGSLFKKYFPRGSGSLKNLAERLREVWRNSLLHPQALTLLDRLRFQIRFDTSWNRAVFCGVVESRFCPNFKERHCRADLGQSEHSVASRTVSAAGFSGNRSGKRLFAA
jgi:hypothetical protein